MAGVDRSKAPPLVTIQSTAPRIVIPTKPAAMRWFRALGVASAHPPLNRLQRLHLHLPRYARILAASDQHRPKGPVLVAVDQQLGESVFGCPELADPVGGSKSESMRTWSSLARGVRPSASRLSRNCRSS
jgi:hypothetical protein